MKFIQGQNRQQIVLIPESLDSLINDDNEVRIIDLFVEALNLNEYSFYIKKNTEGRPQYNPKDLLKLYIYGYLNGIRSSRKLEHECNRNIEVMWLMKQLSPDHNTISNFRKENGKAIKQVFRSTVKLAQQFELIGGKLLAGDSTKLRAQNSKKNNFNQKKIDRHLQYIDNKLEEYNLALQQADGDEQTTAEIKKEIEKHEIRKAGYKNLEQELKCSNQEQISTTDPDSRQMIVRNNITEVAYNIQSTTDAKNCIPIDYNVTQNNDSKAMGNMLQRAKSILQTNEFTALYDKGYYTGSELKTAADLGIQVLVAIPNIPSSSMAPNPAYNVANFIYNQKQNTYTCPQNQTLSTNGNWYKKDRKSDTRKTGTSTLVQHYKTTACKTCPMINECTKNTRGRGRVIERSQYQKHYDKNKELVTQLEKTYKRRQAIVEHNYGTIKRQWNFHYICTKKFKERANSDVGFMFTAYNLRRILNLIDKNLLKAYFRKLSLYFLTKINSFLANLSYSIFDKINSTNNKMEKYVTHKPLVNTKYAA